MSECSKANTKNYLELRGNQIGLAVCAEPHVIVNAARTFAVFSDEYLVVPKTQIGVRSISNDAQFLKAMSLYLSSDFAFYHQFFTAPQFGVKRDVATLRALRSIPVPIAGYTQSQLKPWVELHAALARTSAINIGERKHRRANSKQKQFKFDDGSEHLNALLQQMNNLVYDALCLDDRDRALIDDFVRIRLELIDGKIGQPAVRPSKPAELKAYARRLKSDLDAFIGDELGKRHQIGIVYDALSSSGMIQIDLIDDAAAARMLRVVSADDDTARELEKARRRVRKQQSQWVYFDRNLRIYEGTKTFVLKPLQRFHWTESQAMLDANEIIAENLQLGDDSP